MSLQGSWVVSQPGVTAGGTSIAGTGITAAAAFAATTIGSTASNATIIFRELNMLPCQVVAIGFTVTVAVTTTAPVLTFTVNPVPGTATGARTLGTLTVPVSVAGSVCINYILGAETSQLVDPGEDNPIYVNPGEEIVGTITAIGTGTGGGTPWVAKRYHQVGSITQQTIVKPYGSTVTGSIYIVTA